MADLINPNPTVFERKETERSQRPPKGPGEALDTDDIFEHIRDIEDPEHPYSLEQLNVVKEELISLDNSKQTCKVQFTPTIDHCSLATLIGLCIRTQLIRKLPETFKIDIMITKGGHESEDAVNKQLNDKERVAAALENVNLLKMVEQCLSAGQKAQEAREAHRGGQSVSSIEAADEGMPVCGSPEASAS